MRISNHKSSSTVPTRVRPVEKGRTVRAPAQIRSKLEEAFGGDAHYELVLDTDPPPDPAKAHKTRSAKPA